jgi:hypothetical protein
MDGGISAAHDATSLPCLANARDADHLYAPVFRAFQTPAKLTIPMP